MFATYFIHGDLELCPFDPKMQRVHLCPKMHQCCRFGENPFNTFQDMVLTMSGTHTYGQTDEQTHRSTARTHERDGNILPLVTLGGAKA